MASASPSSRSNGTEAISECGTGSRSLSAIWSGHRRWWCAVGVNVGNELDGTGKEHDRPVLVIRPFNAETFFGVALIGHLRVGRYYFPLGKVDDREAVAEPLTSALVRYEAAHPQNRHHGRANIPRARKALALTLFPFLLLK